MLLKEAFYKNPAGRVDARCKPCAKAHRHELYIHEYGGLKVKVLTKSNADPLVERARQLKLKYGLTEAEVTLMKLQQNSACAICKETSRLVIDHCHASGAVRGLLCFKCNAGLGFFKDRISYLTAAIKYLEK